MFEAEIDRGMEWFDRVLPDWETTIDLSELDMADCQKCMVGQAAWRLLAHYPREYRSTAAYTAVLNEYDEIGLDPEDYGFDIGPRPRMPGSPLDSYRQLTAEWETAIEKRLANKGLLGVDPA